MKHIFKFFIVFLLFCASTIWAQTSDFQISKQKDCINQNITYTDNSSLPGENIVSWNWDFGTDGSPATADVKGPHGVLYGTSGLKNVSLTITGSLGTKSIVSKTVTIDGYSLTGNLTSSKNPVCANEQFTLNTSGSAGTVQWRISPDGYVWTDVIGANTPNVTTSIQNARYYQVRAINGECPGVFSTALGISVDQPSNGGLVYMNSFVCKGTAVDISLYGYTGLLLDWEKSLDNFNWTSLNTNIGNYVEYIVEPTQYYRSKVKNGVCPAAYSPAKRLNSSVCGVNARWTLTTPSSICILNSTSSGIRFFDSSSANGNTLTGWHWDFGSDASTQFHNTASPPIIYYGTTGIKRISLTVTGMFGAIGTYTGIITISGVSKAGSITASNTAICLTNPVSISVTGFTADKFIWLRSMNTTNYVFVSSTTGVTLTETPTDSVYYKVKVTNGACPIDSTNALYIIVTPQPEIETLSYTNGILGNKFCLSGSNPYPTVSGINGGYFSATSSGITISNTISGIIQLSASTQGTYTVNYSIPSINGCQPRSKSTEISLIQQLPLAIAYPATDFCTANTLVVMPAVFTYPGQTFFSNISGISLNSQSGSIQPNASSANSYIIKYSIPSILGCPSSTSTGTTITISAPPSIPDFSYGSSPYCNENGVANPTIIPTGGFFKSNLTGLNSITGTITLVQCPAGTHSIKYTIDSSASCPEVSKSTQIQIQRYISIPNFSYPNILFCNTESNPKPVTNPITGGKYIASSSLPINPITGEIYLNSVSGIFVVTYTIPGTGVCPGKSSSDSITIIATPPTPTFIFERCILKQSNFEIDTKTFWSKDSIPFKTIYSDTYEETLTAGYYKIRSSRGSCRSNETNLSIYKSEDNITITSDFGGNYSSNCKKVPTPLPGDSTTVNILVYEEENLKIYPNPATGTFYIESLNDEPMTILNYIGELVFSQKLKAGMNIIQTSLSPGLYFIHSGNRSRKLIIQ